MPSDLHLALNLARSTLLTLNTACRPIWLLAIGELLELVRRAVHCGDLKPQFRPVDFLQWTRKLEITIDADLTSAIEKVIRRSGAPDKPQSPRTTDMKIILGIAITKYGYDPRSPRNAAAGAIAEDCERLNLKCIA